MTLKTERKIFGTAGETTQDKTERSFNTMAVKIWCVANVSTTHLSVKKVIKSINEMINKKKIN